MGTVNYTCVILAMDWILMGIMDNGEEGLIDIYDNTSIDRINRRLGRLTPFLVVLFSVQVEVEVVLK